MANNKPVIRAVVCKRCRKPLQRVSEGEHLVFFATCKRHVFRRPDVDGPVSQSPQVRVAVPREVLAVGRGPYAA